MEDVVLSDGVMAPIVFVGDLVVTPRDDFALVNSSLSWVPVW